MNLFKKFFSPPPPKATYKYIESQIKASSTLVSPENMDYDKPMPFVFTGIYVGQVINFTQGTTFRQAVQEFTARYPELKSAAVYYSEKERTFLFRFLDVEDRNSHIESEYRL